MFRLLAVLLIALLPLRGWAGNFMSLQMAMSAPATAHSAAAMPPDCPMHSHADAAAQAEAQGQAPTKAFQNCNSCELCVPIAELAAARIEIASFAIHVKPSLGDVGFLSALPAPAFKPPIS